MEQEVGSLIDLGRSEKRIQDPLVFGELGVLDESTDPGDCLKEMVV